MTQDEQHLRLLSIFHYISGALSGLYCLSILIFGVAFVKGNFPGGNTAPPSNPLAVLMGWCFVLIFAIGVAFSICTAFVANFLSVRKHYHFCLVIAGIECLNQPFGTVLGIFTILVLMRESVRKSFKPQHTVPSAFTEEQEGKEEDCPKAMNEVTPSSESFAETLTNNGVELAAQGRYEEAEKAYQEAIRIVPGLVEARYSLACCYALGNKKGEALDALRIAVEKGFDDWPQMQKDKDLVNLKDDPWFRLLDEKVRILWNEKQEMVVKDNERQVSDDCEAICPRCHAEYIAGVKECKDCGVPLVNIADLHKDRN